jgi:hypothetical protein
MWLERKLKKRGESGGEDYFKHLTHIALNITTRDWYFQTTGLN